MRIAIPADGNNLETSVCASFGRAPYFMIYDTETKEATAVENHAAASAGGAGIKAAQIILDHKANALLTPRLGTNAADVLKSAQIDIYKTKAGSVKENIDAFIAGELGTLDEIHGGFHGRGDR